MPKAEMNGIGMYYQVQGQGEPLVLIPGLGADHTSWFLQARAFKKHYRVITFDGRGMGKTDKPADPFTLETMADDVVALMDHLGADAANIVAVSMGGLVAQEIALDHPDRVRKLVLASSTSGDGSGRQPHPELTQAIGLDPESNEIDFNSVDFRLAMKVMISLSFKRWLYRTMMLLLSRFYVKPAAYEGLVGELKAIAGHSTLDRLHQIQCPTLVIAGTDDKIVPPESSGVLAHHISGARLVMVEGGSHSFFVEMRGRFNREVLDFLRNG